MIKRISIVFLFIAFFPLCLFAQETQKDLEAIYKRLNQELDSLKEELVEKTELKNIALAHEKEVKKAKEEAQKVMIKNLLNEAINDYQQQNYARSIELLQQILFIDPKNKKAKEYLSLSQQAQSNPPLFLTQRQQEQKKKNEGAIIQYNKEKDKDGVGNLLAGAQQSLEKGDFQLAAEGFIKVLRISPANPQAEEGLNRVKLGLDKQTNKSIPKEPTLQEVTLEGQMKVALKLLEEENYTGAQKEFLALLEKVGSAKQDVQTKAVLNEAKQSIKTRSEEAFSSIADAQFIKAEKSLLDILEKIKVLAAEKKKKEEEKKLEFIIANHMETALKYLSQSDYDNTKKELEKILAIDPNNSQALILSEKIKEIVEIVGSNQ